MNYLSSILKMFLNRIRRFHHKFILPNSKITVKTKKSLEEILLSFQFASTHSNDMHNPIRLNPKSSFKISVSENKFDFKLNEYTRVEGYVESPNSEFSEIKIEILPSSLLELSIFFFFLVDFYGRLFMLLVSTFLSLVQLLKAFFSWAISNSETPLQLQVLIKSFEQMFHEIIFGMPIYSPIFFEFSENSFARILYGVLFLSTFLFLHINVQLRKNEVKMIVKSILNKNPLLK